MGLSWKEIEIGSDWEMCTAIGAGLDFIGSQRLARV